MKKALSYILFTLIVVSCSTDSGMFRMEGKFKNFNQGELYVYSLTGKGKIDTIRLMEGKFVYEVPMEDTVMLSVVFPNYSEIPVVAAPGSSVTMTGNASHLREVSVQGTEENEALTQFRLKVNDQTPPEAEKSAAAFITEHPSSPACMFVLNKYFILKANADYKKSGELLQKMMKARPGNKKMAQQRKMIEGLRQSAKGSKLPAFSVTSVTGKRVTNADLTGDLNVITLWAVWNYESQGIQRQLRQLKKQYGQRLQLLSISIDGNPADCKQVAKRDSLSWPVVCDGRMWTAPIIQELGFYVVPDVIVADRSGRIIARRLTGTELKNEIEKQLKN